MIAITHDSRERPALHAASCLRPEQPVSSERPIRFPQGLPGFPHLTRFRLAPLAGTAASLLLAALDDPGIRFVVLPHGAGLLAEDDVAAACEAALGCTPADSTVLLVVSLQDVAGERRAFVNLRAPILLDTVRRVAVQHVLPNPFYPVRYPLPGVGRACDR